MVHYSPEILGYVYTPTFSQLFKLNFLPLLKKVKQLLDKWNSGLHSWFGRYSILKMSILPKFLYLLQTIPIRIPVNYFNQVRAAFIHFLWAGKRPRPHRGVLSLPKSNGGLAMLDLRTYYRATHLSRLIDWCRHTHTKLWTRIEQAQSVIPLPRAPWCHTSLPIENSRHPLIGNTVRICSQLIHTSPHFSRNSPLRPILGNPQFEPGLRDRRFLKLKEEGLYQASHFSSMGRWKTISELTDLEGQFRLDSLRAMQLHHYLRSLTPPCVANQTPTTMEVLCTESGNLPYSLSLTYKLLITPPGEYQTQSLTKWERELNCIFTTNKKQQILTFTHKSSICTKIQETNYKILTHWYRTPALLKKIFPSTTDVCWRCQEERGTLIHIFWTCSRIRDFWRDVRLIIQKFTDRTVPDDPAYFLLHATDTPARIYKKSVVRHLLDAAKACIPSFWKSTHTPSIAFWLQIV